MKQEITIKLKDKSKAEIAAGYPLITKDSLEGAERLQEEGTIINLTDSKGRFVAKAYYGNQNKGVGWVLTRDETENIDQPEVAPAILALYRSLEYL